MLKRVLLTGVLLIAPFISNAAIVEGFIENSGNDLTISQVIVTADSTGIVSVDSSATTSFVDYLMVFDGSTQIADSFTDFMTFNAVAGQEYMITIGQSVYFEDEALAGLQQLSSILSGEDTANWTLDITNASVAAVPVPAALPLFASALLGLGFSRRKSRR